MIQSPIALQGSKTHSGDDPVISVEPLHMGSDHYDVLFILATTSEPVGGLPLLFVIVTVLFD